MAQRQNTPTSMDNANFEEQLNRSISLDTESAPHTFEDPDAEELAGVREKGIQSETLWEKGRKWLRAVRELTREFEPLKRSEFGDVQYILRKLKQGKEQAAQQKAQHYLLPPEFLKQVTAVLEHGADKYGPYNWREGDGIKQDVYISATFRHLLAIMEGEWLDPESGKSHWSHIAATAAIMVDAIKHDKLKR